MTPSPHDRSPRAVTQGARDKQARLQREIEREAARVAELEGKLGAAAGAAADALTALAAEEAEAQRAKVEAEASRLLAAAKLEEARAILAGLTAMKAQAEATLERIANQQGQFGARRMTAEAEIKRARDGVGVKLRESTGRLEDLRGRLARHLKEWPELGVPPS
jgi:hypothetical protein